MNSSPLLQSLWCPHWLFPFSDAWPSSPAVEQRGNRHAQLMQIVFPEATEENTCAHTALSATATQKWNVPRQRNRSATTTHFAWSARSLSLMNSLHNMPTFDNSHTLYTAEVKGNTHIFLCVLHWAAYKGDDPHLVVFTLSVFQSQLRAERRDYSCCVSACFGWTNLMLLQYLCVVLSMCEFVLLGPLWYQ